MTETDAVPRTTDDEPARRIDPRFVEGRGRLVLFGGAWWLALGEAVGIAPVVWGGVVIVAGAFGLDTVGKLLRYRALPIPSADRLTLGATRTLLALAAVAVLAGYADGRYGGGGIRILRWLATAGVGCGLLHVAARSLYLPARESAVDGDVPSE
ncbi:hypothetical protein C474_03295 [Halogeometricum pallidum JCM 14848]|uniref:Uncharacterized protein n=1 Tax=Halogeometricum pallidum JCM 14848 TaxID=1227487 RepID=M0DGV7_HALPD|nr:hypothetical protein [Halogeometricum pallidum]ELZ33952.1 hypothetical protein C474_03295 [Halogeometricum pallidum JCM 14848]